MKKSPFLFIICLHSTFLFSQLGGINVFEFLNSPGSARQTALGGSLIMVEDGDGSLVNQNPALSNPLMDNKISFNHQFHLAGIQEGMLNYSFQPDSLDLHFHVGLQYVSFGNFIQADEIGNQIGEFSASEAAIFAGASKKINERIKIGANLKFLTANYASENGFGVGVDLGAKYKVPGKPWDLGIALQNVGLAFGSLHQTNRKLPLDLKIGYSFRLKHLPFRYSITGHHLYQWNIRYIDPESINQPDILGGVVTENRFKSEVDNFFRHFVFAGEFLFGKRGLFNLRFAYNHLRRQELKVSSFTSLGGFSLGFGMHIKRFQIDYGVGFYNLAGATNHLGIRINLRDDWNK